MKHFIVAIVLLICTNVEADENTQCFAGQRRDPSGGGCRACEPGRYNNGGMAWDETSCFEVESGEGYLYYDAKNVMCDRDRDYHGIPLYSPGGEYNGGCVECSEDDGCPTDPCLAGYRRHASLACVPCAPDRQPRFCRTHIFRSNALYCTAMARILISCVVL